MPHVPFRVWVIVAALMLIIGGGFLYGYIKTERAAVAEAQGVVEGRAEPTRLVLQTIMEKRFFDYQLHKRVGIDPALDGKLGYSVSSIRCTETQNGTFKCRFSVSPYLLDQKSYLKSQVVEASLRFHNGVWLVELH